MVKLADDRRGGFSAKPQVTAGAEVQNRRAGGRRHLSCSAARLDSIDRRMAAYPA